LEDKADKVTREENRTSEYMSKFKQSSLAATKISRLIHMSPSAVKPIDGLLVSNINLSKAVS
jgi:hypothetical protein